MFFNGIPVHRSDFCTQEVFNFPVSKNRSARLHKKLLRRYGVQSYRKPAAYLVQGRLTAHTEIIKQMFAEQKIVRVS